MRYVVGTFKTLSLLAALGGIGCAPAFLTLWCPSPIKTTTFQRGSGTASDPYVICSPSHFQNISTAPSAYFRVGANLDFSGFTFTPIPTFTGTLEGGGATLSNLTITSSAGNSGIIGTSAGTISNLTIHATITDTGGYSGILAATVFGGTITNVMTTGSVTATEFAGGLVGATSGVVSIQRCVSSASVTSTGPGYSGGLVGGIANGTTISNSYATGSVSASGAGDYLGGLVGLVDTTTSTITSSGATGSVTGGLRVGGLIGAQGSGNTVSGSFATGNASGSAGVGGLIGEAAGLTQTSYATGNATATVFLAGGLVGFCNGCSIADSYARGGSISAPTNASGGLIGANAAAGGTVVRSYSASVSVTGGGAIGGFIGEDNQAGAAIDETTCFFDSTLVASPGTDGTGIPTSSMQDPSYFLAAGYSNTTWNLDGGTTGYMRLR